MSILREVTLDKHQQVESLPFVQYLLKGNITEEHYVIYLAEMLVIYQRLEQLAGDLGLLDDLPELPRAEKMRLDLQELDPLHQISLGASTCDYLDYIEQLASSERSDQLFAHIYVRHLGDMYGGKMISRVIPGTGRWYQFDNRSELVKRFNSQLNMDLAGEALTAFDYFGKIFNDLWKKTKHNGS
jgi:heme oxygenase